MNKIEENDSQNLRNRDEVYLVSNRAIALLGMTRVSMKSYYKQYVTITNKPSNALALKSGEENKSSSRLSK